MKAVVFIVFLMAPILAISVGNECVNSFYEANKLYQNGQIQKAIDLLEPCYQSNSLNRIEKKDAARLLALCHIATNDEERAEMYAVAMLKLQPTYKQYPKVDPKELTNILDKLTVQSKLDFGFAIGLSTSGVKVLNDFSPTNSKTTYTNGFGLSGGVILEYKLRKGVTLSLNPMLSSMSYTSEIANVAGSSKQFTEQINAFAIPLKVGRYFGYKNIQLHTEIGLQYNVLHSSFADMQSTSLLDGSVFQSSTSTKSGRAAGAYGLVASLSVKYPLGNGLLSGTISTSRFLNNFVIAENRYSNTKFILDAQYIDPDFTMYSTAFSISYQVPIYYKIPKL